jgi:hypothetical protein
MTKEHAQEQAEWSVISSVDRPAGQAIMSDQREVGS